LLRRLRMPHTRGAAPTCWSPPKRFGSTSNHYPAAPSLPHQLIGGGLQTIETAENLPHLLSFTVGLRRDQDAVTNGLTFKHNSGRIEGSVNKIKMIKREMYGRANLALFRKRLIYAT